MREELEDTTRREAAGLAISLWVLLPVIVFVTYWMQILDMLSAVGCEGVCDLELSLGARAAYPWEVGASVAIAIVVAVVLRSRGKSPHWAPLVGVVLVVVSGIATSVVFHTGLAPMYERNDRIARGEAPAEAPVPLPDPVGTWEARVDGAPYLVFSTDGSVTGFDGCNALDGRWTQDSEGTIVLDTVVEAARTCDGVDAWLGRGHSAEIIENYMYVNGAEGSPIGGLQPAR
jgi:hypothetical protein